LKKKPSAARGLARLMPIHNYPVVPEESPLRRPGSTPPVTRSDWGADFRNALYFSRMRSDVAHQMFCNVRLASATWTQWYDNVEDLKALGHPEHKGEPAPDWEETASSYAKQGLFVMFNSWAVSEISKSHHDRMVKLLGPRFIGHDEGEWDGAYVAQIAGHTLDLAPTRSRREACRHYMEWLKATYERHHNRMATTNSLLYGMHYSAELGARMLGLELGESLPSDTLMLVFCRGACKQFDLLMQTFPAVFSVRGIKTYPRQDQPQSIVAGGYLAGPEHGTTLGLLKRQWWCSYMSGANLIGIQFGYFPTDYQPDNFMSTHDSLPVTEPVTLAKVLAHFTPLGWLFWEARKTARKHPVRGVPYIPFAVMLHHDHGWYPTPNGYVSPELNQCVWGNIPHNRGDTQTDLFFQWVYPGYQRASDTSHGRDIADEHAALYAERDERGKIVNTPFGDAFDVILSNAEDACLAKYQAIILLGSWDVSAEKGLAERLERFIKAGGRVIADVSQWKALPRELAKAAASRGKSKATVQTLSLGKGSLLRVMEPGWGADRAGGGVFEAVTHALKQTLEHYDLIEIEGRVLYHLVNVTDQPDELLVTLCNNSQALPWEGSIRVKGQEIVDVEEWLAFGEADIKNGTLRCGVPANDVRIFRVKTRTPFLPLKHRVIDWKKLGVGALE